MSDPTQSSESNSWVIPLVVAGVLVVSAPCLLAAGVASVFYLMRAQPPQPLPPPAQPLPQPVPQPPELPKPPADKGDGSGMRHGGGGAAAQTLNSWTAGPQYGPGA